jgi:N-acetylneuraminic acid mutarotase
VHGHILAIGGQTGNDAGLTTHASVFHYEPETNTWTARASMPRAISHISSSTFVYNGRVFVMGGETAHATAIRDVYAFDHTADTWSTLTPLPANRFSGVAAEIGGILYFTGGSSQTTTWKGELFA